MGRIKNSEMEAFASLFLAGFCTFEYVVFWRVVLQPMLPSLLGFVACSLVHFIGALVLMSLYATIKTDPGIVPWDTECHGHFRVGSPLEVPVTSLGENLSSPEEEATLEQSYCRKCHQTRPMRAHHCSTCDRCIEEMD